MFVVKCTHTFLFFQFIFVGEKIEPNTTVAIAQVMVTTATCVEGKSAVIPAFADPGIFFEDMHKFHAIKKNKFHAFHVELHVHCFEKCLLIPILSMLT